MGKPTFLSLEELDVLSKRALLSAAMVERRSPLIRRAYERVADALTALYALEQMEARQLGQAPVSASDLDQPDDEPLDEETAPEAAAPAPAQFRVRPRNGGRCGICGAPQVATRSGLTCRNGHGGAPTA